MYLDVKISFQTSFGHTTWWDRRNVVEVQHTPPFRVDVGKEEVLTPCL